MIILGLDSSCTTTGWAFSENGKILDAGFIDTKKLVTTKEKTYFVISILEKSKYISSIDHINLEAALSGFAGGFTSQQTIIKLAKHSAVFEYILKEHFKKPVNLLSVNSMRKKLFGRCRIQGIKSKEFVKLELEKLIPEVKNYVKLTNRGNWDLRNSDMYDAIVCSVVP